MLHWLKQIRRSIRVFVLAQRGAAVVEFALVLPLMLLVYIGVVEASTLITMDRKVQSVAGAVGDLVARTDKSLTSTQMQDYFRASSGIMTPYSPEPVLQVVSAVAVDSEGETTITWSRQFQNGVYSETTPRVPNTAFPLPDEMIDISKGQTVIVAEASYAYTPLFGLVFDQPVNLYRSSFYLPRFGGTIAIN